jgi:anaerobic selenocysteine-containing dehydrogenase
MMGPATVYLDRFRREGDAVAGRRRPAAMEGATDGRVPRAELQYPYGSPRDERVPDRVVPGGCNICFNACSTNYHFAGNKLVKVTGNDSDPHLKGRVCPKSQLSVQLYASERRLQRPLKRVGARGEGRFEPITWNQALDEITDRMKAIRDTWGAEAVGIFAGTRTGTITRNGFIRIFAQMFGTPNVEGTDPFCSASKHAAYEATQGDPMPPNSYTEGDIGTASLYVYFGENQAEARPVYFGMVNNWRVRNRARMIVVDPRYTATASKADRWLGIRTGTDMALALAMAQHILAHDLHDKAFCGRWVEGWEQWRDYIAEKGYTPEWAATVTGLRAD